VRAQVLFSNSLMLGSFKGLEARRQEVMRQIEEGNKQTLIDELKKVLEQKSAFMSAVSHELRTPLNGIIGER
jgi:signal transduction histidine kinase